MFDRIGTIGNCYGSLGVNEVDGKYFWSIEGWADKHRDMLNQRRSRP